MSSIDLAILGMVWEKPQSAYDIRKDVTYHHISEWTRISVPSIYRKVIEMAEKGYLQSEIVKGEKFAEKAVYSITDKGRTYFHQLMCDYAEQLVPLQFDFNVVIANLNKLDKEHALDLVRRLRDNIEGSLKTTEEYADQYADIPLGGRAIFDQQRRLYLSLIEWLNDFEREIGADY